MIEADEPEDQDTTKDSEYIKEYLDSIYDYALKGLEGNQAI